MIRRTFQTTTVSRVFRGQDSCSALMKKRFFSSSSSSSNTFDPTATPASFDKLTSEEKVIVRKRRMLLHSRNRGRVETELFLGGFATDHVWDMKEEEMTQFEKILNETDVDLFNWLTNLEPMPQDIAELPVMQKVIDYMKNKRSNHYLKSSTSSFNADYNNADCVTPAQNDEHSK